MSDNLPDDPETLKAMLLAERHESERLLQIIKELQRHRFGRKAESLPEEQMLLGLEDVQQVAAFAEASQDETAPEGRAERACKRRVNRGALPAHLLRIEVVVDIDDKTFPAARANCIGSVKTGAGGWTWCRRSSALSSPDVPNTPAAPAKMASCRPRLRPG
ncbi:hypothetical protein ABIA85_009698 [Bradyrhizobium sp. LA6.10]